MRRRRYLQTAGMVVTGGLPGWSELGVGTEMSPTAMDEPTPTETPTSTAEPTPRQEPPNVAPPLWLLLLAREHLDNAGGVQ